MGQHNSNFNSNKYYLGPTSLNSDSGTTSDDVSSYFTKNLEDTTRFKCFACGNKPTFRIMAKGQSTAELDKGIYICNHCASQQILDPSQYGLRPLNPS